MIIFTSPLEVGILLPGMVEHAHFVDVPTDLAVREIPSEVGVFERIVVW